MAAAQRLPAHVRVRPVRLQGPRHDRQRGGCVRSPAPPRDGQRLLQPDPLRVSQRELQERVQEHLSQDALVQPQLPHQRVCPRGPAAARSAECGRGLGALAAAADGHHQRQQQGHLKVRIKHGLAQSYDATNIS